MACNNDCFNCPYDDCIKGKREYDQEYYENNKAECKRRTNKWKSENKEHVREYNRAYRKTEKRMQYMREYARERYRKNERSERKWMHYMKDMDT